MSITAIAGLGNPGSKYRDTRHNVGFRVIDALGYRYSAKWKSEGRGIRAESAAITIGTHNVHLIKPMNFMNNSGKVIREWCRYYQVEPSALAVIHDDTYLEAGRLKISLGGGDGGHNGIADLVRHLGEGFTRFRIGIGKKTHPGMDLADYVLGRFSEEDSQAVETGMPKFLEGLISLVQSGPMLTMNNFNQRKTQDDCSNETSL